MKIWSQHGPNSNPPGIPTSRGMGLLLGLFCSGGPWEPHLSTEPLKVTPGAPKCLPKWSQIIGKIPQRPSTNKQKTRQSMDTRFYLKNPNKKMAGIPPCLSCFFGARILRRVWMPAFSQKQLLKKWRAFRPVSHAFWCSDFRQSMDASCQ